MAVLTATGITYSDGSTTASTSTHLAVGSFAILLISSSSLVNAGATISGSTLFYQSSGTAGFGITNVSSSSGNRLNTTTSFTDLSARVWTPTAGTWRSVYLSRTGGASYDSCANQTNMGLGFFVRVS